MSTKKIKKILTEAELKKKYGDDSYMVIDLEDELSKIPRLPCRNLALNHLLGGGIPYGKIMEEFGYESTGKSLMAYDFAKVCQDLGGMVLLVDAENAFELAWARMNDLDPSRLQIYSNSSVDDIGDWTRDQIYYWRSKLTNNEPILLIIDSIAALDKSDNLEGDMVDKKAQMGNRAKAIGDFLRTRNQLFKRAGICVIPINQVRKKLGATMWEVAETTPGGDALRFYAAIRLMLIKSTQIKGLIKDGKFVESKEDGQKIGQNVIIRTEKNKVSPPRPSLKTEVYFVPDKWGYVGYNRYMGLETILVDEGIIERRGTRYYYDNQMIANGDKDLIKKLHTKPKMRAKLIKKSSINTTSKTRALIESLTRNLYPV